MPNAARLVAALSLAILAFILTGQVMDLMPEREEFGYFPLVNIVLGLVVGWTVMGKRAGFGITPGINNGITGVVVLLFWGLFVQGCNEMVRLAMRNRYDGPFEAIAAAFELSFEYAMMIAVPNIILTLVIGAVVSGLATEYAHRKWP